MTTNRTTGMVTQAAQPARSQPSASVLHLYPEFLKSLPFGLVLLHLENPRDSKLTESLTSTRRLRQSLGLLWKTF